MFLFECPSAEAIEEFVRGRSQDKFSYPEVGATRDSTAPAGYNVDHNRQLLGNGADAFATAKQAIREWRMFDFPWVKLSPPTTPIEVGGNVAIMVAHYGFYSLNAARIVYVIDDNLPEIKRFGFAYGTLTEHGEVGEERFSVAFHGSGEVWYDVFAFSRPGNFLAKLGYPFSRRLQKQFAIDSKKAMLEAVAGPNVEFPK
jgi:uncharacterized protein (UPF0548 family)